jgi:hypothetical protein
MNIPPDLVAAWERLKRRETKEDRRLIASVGWSVALAAFVVILQFIV